MIFPWLDGIRGLYKAPITWLIILVNVLCALATSQTASYSQSEVEQYFKRDVLVEAQGEVFAEFVSQNSDYYGDLYLKMAELANSGHGEQRELLGRLAMRDQAFVERGPAMNFSGDQVLFDFWKEEFAKIRSTLKDDPMINWGLAYRESPPVKWFTYQFMHGGFWHLFTNMIFLLIFGSALEPLIGSIWFLIVYLASGFLAAGAYVELSGLTGIPLVGASGAVSGLMSLYVALNWEKKVNFLYWLFIPLRGYSGFVSLPAWVLLIVWGIQDLAGYYGTVKEIGGIAHAAHLGGAFVGLILGYFFRVWGKSPTHRVLGHTPGL